MLALGNLWDISEVKYHVTSTSMLRVTELFFLFYESKIIIIIITKQNFVTEKNV
jgi:hypothetical protein